VILGDPGIKTATVYFNINVENRFTRKYFMYAIRFIINFTQKLNIPFAKNTQVV